MAAETSQGGLGGMQGSHEFLAKLVEFVRVDVADRPKIEAVLRPMAHIEALPRFAISPRRSALLTPGRRTD